MTPEMREMLDEIKRLREIATEAINEFEDAYKYADKYFVEKWDYAGIVARLRKELAE